MIACSEWPLAHLVIIHQHFGHSGGVPPVAVVRNEVGMCGSKDVPDMATRDRLHPSTAHPNPKRKFEIFTAPTDHARVVSADVEEEFAVDAEETAGHGRCRRRIARLAVGGSVLVRLPGEMAGP